MLKEVQFTHAPFPCSALTAWNIHLKTTTIGSSKLIIQQDTVTLIDRHLFTPKLYLKLHQKLQKVRYFWNV